MPHIETSLKVGDVRHELRRGRIAQEFKSGHVTSVIKVIITGGVDTTNDVLLESGSFRLLENGDKLLLG